MAQKFIVAAQECSNLLPSAICCVYHLVAVPLECYSEVSDASKIQNKIQNTQVLLDALEFLTLTICTSEFSIQKMFSF